MQARSFKQVQKAIKKKYDVEVGLFKADGVFTFYPLDENDTELADRLISGKDGQSAVYVFALNHLTVDQWLESFNAIYGE